MGFDLDTQQSGTLPGAGRVEVGTVDFSNGSSTAEVATRLTKAYFGMGMVKTNTTTSQGTHGGLAHTDLIISSGAVTFKRVADYRDEDATYMYMLVGW